MTSPTTNPLNVAGELLTLYIDEYEAVMLWAMVNDSILKSHKELMSRRVLKLDGTRNPTKKYLSLYEKEALEEYERLVNLEKMLLDMLPSTELTAQRKEADR